MQALVAPKLEVGESEGIILGRYGCVPATVSDRNQIPVLDRNQLSEGGLWIR